MNNIYRASLNYKKNRGAKAPQNKKFSLKKVKANTIQSLTDVGYFFNNFSHFMKYVKLYKILKLH